MTLDPLANLAPDKLDALMARLTAKRHKTAPKEERIPIVPRDKPIHHLSFAQQRLWFLNRLEPDNPFYNISTALELKGRLDVLALEQALADIVARHEILRTVFSGESGVGGQSVLDEGLISLERIELDEESGPALRHITRERMCRPFKLDTLPLFRVVHIQLGPEHPLLQFVFHHIVMDGWSVGLFYRELASCYRARLMGQNPELPTPTLQYVDYSCWQRERFKPGIAKPSLAYWQNKLAGAPPAIVPPSDRPAPEGDSYNGAVYYFKLPKSLTDATRELGNRHGATLFMTLLAVFKVQLHALTEESDLVVGSAIANRNHVELESMLGFCVNTLALRTSLAGNPRFTELLERVRTTTFDAYAHQDTPFETVVDALNPERAGSHTPLFQVMFALQNTPIALPDLPELIVRDRKLGSSTARFPLNLSLTETADGLEALFEYNTDRFTSATVEAFAEQFRILLTDAVASPEQRLSKFSLMSPALRKTVLAQARSGARPYPREQNIPALFAAQVEARPNSTALAFRSGGQQSLTYAQVGERSDNLAAALFAHGVRYGGLVAMCLPRSLGLPVSLLAILKTGAAYLPLDPEYPTERLAFMLADSGAKHLVTVSHLAALLPTDGIDVICLDLPEDQVGSALEPPNDLLPAFTPAYIMYTSGSTGRPKGSVITHRNIVRLVMNTDFVELGPAESMLQFTSTSFDASTLEIWGALLNGCRLEICPPQQLSLEELAHIVHERHVSTLFFPTGLYAQMALEHPHCFRGVRQAMTGGDVLSPDAVANLLQHSPETIVLNGYGPTEACTFATVQPVHAGDRIEGAVPIGPAIANTRVYVLNRYLEPVPPGVPGHLYVGGDGVGTGYHQRPRLTAERFIPNPFPDEPGERLYTTGDRVCATPDGTIHFLGRLDHQVKIRGFRVELGEIEKTLTTHPAVKDAAVIARHDHTDEKNLYGYWVPQPVAGTDPLVVDGYVDQWMRVFQDNYDQPETGEDPTFGISGWVSSYTGHPIPAVEMGEWVDLTLARIRALNPKRVLEIGCGTGLLLTKLAPTCEAYVGTDFSAAVLQRLGGSTSSRAELSHVRLLQQAADCFDGLEQGTFDTVVLNSIVQYFPDLDYLVRVIQGALGLLTPNGHLFVGDVRNHDLLTAFHSSVQLHKAEPALQGTRLAGRILRALTEEEELLVSPAFFVNLAGTGRQHIQPKVGTYRNEMSCFRYDVTLSRREPETLGVEWVTLPESERTLDMIFDRAEQTGLLALADLPDARLTGLDEVLIRARDVQRIDHLRETLLAEAARAIDPSQLQAQAAAREFKVVFSMPCGGRPGFFDAVIHRRRGLFEVPPRLSSVGDGVLANDPLLARRGNALNPEIKQFLANRLPPYMKLAALIPLERLSRNAVGKLDAHSLPDPVYRHKSQAERQRPPHEELLAGIWCDVLGLDHAGADDNFFDLGGHSLLATRVVSRIASVLGVALPLRVLFDNPILADLGKKIQDASNSNSNGQSEIVPLSRKTGVPTKPVPLSFSQQRLWFLGQFESKSAVYNLCLGLQLSGELQQDRLRTALQEICTRHETLRTAFREINGHPRQVVLPPETVLPLEVVDLTDLPKDQRSTRCRELADREAVTPFDLGKAPLTRILLIRSAGERHLLVVNMHHIISDGWSLAVFARELKSAYAGSSLPAPLRVQYADFSAHQQTNLDQLAKSTVWWKEQLAGGAPVARLPFDFPPPAIQTFNGAFLHFTFEPELCRALQRLSRERSVTLFMTLLAAFKALIYRYTVQEDVLVGSPIANRTRTELEDLIGFFVNTLVLRSQVTGSLRFCDLLEQIRTTTLAAYAHQNVPFEKLVAELNPERNLSMPPLFQVMFILQNMPPVDWSLPGLKVEPVPMQTGTAKFPLTLSIEEHDDTLRGFLEYNTDLFKPDTAARILSHFRELLEAVVANPTCEIGHLNYLSETERDRLIHGFNRSRFDYGSEICLHQLIEAQVARTPDAPALMIDNGPGFSYLALNAAANRLAHYLHERHVRRGDRVGICLERGADMTIALLAVLKLGAAYVPLDPELPANRLAHILEDAEPVTILTVGHAWQSLPNGVELIKLDEVRRLIAALPDHDPVSRVDPHDAAYVIFTSGSTGRPKGIVNSHAGIVNRLLWMQHYFKLDPEDRVLQKTPFGFDVSVWEFFWPLLCGAGLVSADPGGHRDPDYLYQAINRHRITTLHFVPSMLAAFLASTNKSCPTGQRVICSGEALPRDLAESFTAHFAAGLFNLYGPTEAAVDVSCHPYSLADRETTVPIGGPIHNIELYVLDKQGRLTATGVAGELHIAGIGLAQGYLSRPALTAAAFVPNPFGEAGGERMYRTGDLARFRNDGKLVFMGRIDHQVKLRGFRIEPEEIRLFLCKHPDVHDAAVIVRSNPPSRRRLIAFITVHGRAPQEKELRDFLLPHLPEYAVPARFVAVDALPLSANGKLDRKALVKQPLPDTAPRAQETVEPRTPLERLLVQIWSRVLNISAPGIYDNFFHLGGDSILSLQIVAAAREAGYRLTPKDIFRGPTIAEMAAVCSSAAVSILADHAEPDRPVQLAPIQRRFFKLPLVNRNHWNQSVLLTSTITPTRDQLNAVAKRLVAHHDSLRLRFHIDQHGMTQAPGSSDETYAVTSHALDDPTQITAVAARLQTELDLENGPRFRIATFDLGANHPCRLLLLAHHLLVDAVSWRIIIEDLALLLQDREAKLPPAATSYCIWADHHTAFEFEEEPSIAGLPKDGDKPNGSNLVGEARVVSFQFDEAYTAQLLGAQGAYRTRVDDLLLAALWSGLQQWCGQTRFLIDREAHGRDELPEGMDVSRTTGWFTRIEPVLLEAEGHEPERMIPAIKEQLRAPVSHSGAEICFNYLGRFDEAFPPGSPFAFAAESAGPDQALDNPRPYLMEVGGLVSDRRLYMHITYSPNHFAEAGIQGLAQRCMDALKTLIEHCRQPEVGSYTPSDFPLTATTQGILEALYRRHPDLQDLYPLSPTQQGLFLHTKLDRGGGMYVEQMSCRLTHLTHPDAFARAWMRAAAAFPPLRTGFVQLGDGELLQMVHRQVEIPIRWLDWREQTATERERGLKELLDSDRREGFDLEHPPALRLCFIRESESDYRFIWTHHHIILDGWSLVPLLASVFENYRAELGGRSPRTKSVPNYASYIAWLQQRDRSGEQAFWSHLLADFFHVTSPTMIPAEKNGEPQLLQRELPPETSARLKDFALGNGLTINTLFQGAWARLLACYSGRDDVLFGVTVSGRSAPIAGVAEMVGLFINTLPLRLKLPAKQSVISWLHEIQTLAGDMSAYQHSPLVEIQSYSPLPAGQPLFDSILVLENYPLDNSVSSGSDGIGLQDVQHVSRTNYPLVLSVNVADTIGLRLTYDETRIPAGAAGRLAAHLSHLLKALIAEPEAKLGDISPLIREERMRLLNAGRSAEHESSEPTFIHERFFEIAERFADHPAIHHPKSGTLKYGELGRRVDRLANYLQLQGVGPENLVGIYIRRSPEMVCAILAVLTAGAGFVPIDPDSPDRAVVQLVEDARPALVITSTADAPSPQRVTAPLLVLENHQTSIQAQPAQPPSLQLKPEHPAYVIYTSGSTGVPKGVVVTQHSFSNQIDWMCRRFLCSPQDRVLQKARFTFDGAIWEYLMPLLNGALLVQAPNDKDLTALCRLINEQRITILKLVPTLGRALLREPLFAENESLHTIFFGGEPLDRNLVARLSDLLPVKVHNLYGPTETTMVTTAELDVKPGVSETSPLGGPVTNTDIYILDNHLQPVPDGVVGRLYIAGKAIARGYLNRPGDTAAVFIPHPYSDNLGARFYDSGDLVQRREDGTLIFIGRADRQLAVRGLRIESTEIEHVLRSLPGIRDAAVGATPNDAGEQLLAAYVQPEPGWQLEAGTVRLELRERLPDYKIPNLVQITPRIPLTASGKPDMKAFKPMPTDSDHDAPNGRTEALIARLWCEVLGISSPSRYAGFFELGGHSLALMRIHSGLQRALDRRIQLVDLFNYATIASLATYLDSDKGAQIDVPAGTARAAKQKAARRRMRRERSR